MEPSPTELRHSLVAGCLVGVDHLRVILLSLLADAVEPELAASLLVELEQLAVDLDRVGSASLEP